LWRARYPGGLTGTEEAFAAAMTSLASRRRRRRRMAAVSAFAVLLIVIAVVGNFWRQSVLETRRAEAQKLLALGELALEADPTEAFAWAQASLGLIDTHEGRLFALRVLSKSPIARYLEDGDEDVTFGAAFSPDGEWVTLKGRVNIRAFRRSGGPAVFTDTFPTGGPVVR